MTMGTAVTTIQDVRCITVDRSQKWRHSVLMLEDSIPDGKVIYHFLPAGSRAMYPAARNSAKVLFLIEGTARFAVNGTVYSFDQRASLVPSPEQDAALEATTDVRLLEVHRKLAPEDLEELEGYSVSYPYHRIYEDSVQYADKNTSQKTIKREIVRQHIIPRFAMGSCESFGPDTMGTGCHPHLDQFFFSLPGNDIQVNIDNEPLRLTENTLLHIPLGARHNVVVPEGKYMHYIWIDYCISSEAARGLDSSHVPTGRKRKL